MDLPARQRLIQQIHDSGSQFVLAITGGGSGAIAEVLGVPGGSRSLIEAVVPYSAAALAAWLRAKPEQFCSDRTARAMAMAAYVRGQILGADMTTLAGIGCTASLASDRPKHGDHRVFVAWQTQRASVAARVTLDKGRRTRTQEESLAALLVLNAIADACGVAAMPVSLTDTEPLHITRHDAPQPWQDLWSGRIDRHAQGPDFTLTAPRAIFPGAFNPLHHGHQRMAEISRQRLGSPVAFELSVFNVDKPPLDYLEVSQRLAQFPSDQTVWLTRVPMFAEKADLFPGATFVVGADTIVRIADPKYYGGNPAARDAALAHITGQGCKFLVFGRLVDGGPNGQFQSLAGLTLPDSLRSICQEVPAATFREDVSSTALRQSIT